MYKKYLSRDSLWKNENKNENESHSPYDFTDPSGPVEGPFISMLLQKLKGFLQLDY
eukprot:Pgem_evm1s12978